MALEGLLIVLDGIEKHCQRRISDRVPQPPIYSSSKKCAILPPSPGVQPPIMSKSSGHMIGTSLVSFIVASSEVPRELIQKGEDCGGCHVDDV